MANGDHVFLQSNSKSFASSSSSSDRASSETKGGSSFEEFRSSFSEFLNSGWMLALGAHKILIGWGEWSATEQASLEDGSCSIYAPDFYLQDKKPWKSTRSWALVDRDLFANSVVGAVHSVVNGKDQGFQWVEPELAQFESRFREIRQGFQARGLKKAVPVVFATADAQLTSSSRAARIASLLRQPKTLYPYGFWSENEGMLGATPEILFSRAPGKAFETVALAGTRAKSETTNAAQALLADPKERYEHQLVIEDLKSQLSGIGDVAIGSTEAVELPTLYHLKTRIQARPRGTLSFDDFVKLLHPTPALGVSPRAFGFQEMLRWDDSLVRRRFGAPFGATFATLEGQREHCLVAIRNIQWDSKRIQLGSGCGVVPESDLQREWSELSLKRDSVKRMLSL